MVILLIRNTNFLLARGELELAWNRWRLGYEDLYVEQEAGPRARK
jgi:hypothetical protein